MMRRRSFLAASSATLLGGRTAAAARPIRVVAFPPETSMSIKRIMQPWLAAVEAEIDGVLPIQGYWGGSLGRDPFAQFELVRRGVVDIAFVGAGYTPGQFPELRVSELPYLARGSEEASVAIWRLVQDGLVSGLHGVVPITAWTADISLVHLRRPVQTIAELRTLKLRTAGAVQAQAVAMLGAAPETMTEIEAIDAMQRGGLDGTVQSWNGVDSFGSTAVTRGALDMRLGAIPFLLLANEQRWAEWPETVRQSMLRHGGATMARAGGHAFDDSTKLSRAKHTGRGYQLATPAPEEEAATADMLAPIARDWAARNPRNAEVLAHFTASLEAERSA